MGGYWLYNILVGFAIHQHESATGVHVFPHPESSSHFPSHPIPLGCPRALGLNALLHALNVRWSSVLHMVIYMFQCYPLKPSHPRLLPSLPYPSGLSQNTDFGYPPSYIEFALVICFTYGNIHVSVLFSQITPPSPSPPETKSLFFTSVCPLLPCM